MNRFARKLSSSASRFGRKFSDVGQKFGRKLHAVGERIETVGESFKHQNPEISQMVVKAGQGLKQAQHGVHALESFDQKKIADGLAHLGFQTHHFV